jgi:hypothetical protein
MKFVVFFVGVLLSAGTLVAQPAVDGKIYDGKYSSSVPVLGGKVTVFYQADGSGGLYVAVKGKTKGWIAVGLGSQKMDGATIFIGYVGNDGNGVYSEDSGKGHDHTPKATAVSDQHIVATDGDSTVLEFHLPSSAVPSAGPKGIPFIAAYSDSKDLTSWHGFFNHANGFLS